MARTDRPHLLSERGVALAEWSQAVLSAECKVRVQVLAEYPAATVQFKTRQIAALDPGVMLWGRAIRGRRFVGQSRSAQLLESALLLSAA